MRLAAEEPTVDLSAYRADGGIAVSQTGSQLRVSWPLEDGTGQLDLDLRPGQPLIRTMGIAPRIGEPHTLSSKTPTRSPFCWSAPARRRRAARPA